MSPERIHRPEVPGDAPRRGPGENPCASSRLDEAREAARAARDHVRAIDSLLGTFALEDIRNTGGQ